MLKRDALSRCLEKRKKNQTKQKRNFEIKKDKFKTKTRQKNHDFKTNIKQKNDPNKDDIETKKTKTQFVE